VYIFNPLQPEGLFNYLTFPYHSPGVDSLLLGLYLLVMETNKKFADELSTWSKNGLSRLFGRDVLKEPEVIAGIGIVVLEQAIGLGPKSLGEIAEALYKSGYIDDPVRWLAR
jgi:hypothetical protein